MRADVILYMNGIILNGYKEGVSFRELLDVMCKGRQSVKVQMEILLLLELMKMMVMEQTQVM